jgi:hypothetical protein
MVAELVLERVAAAVNVSPLDVREPLLYREGDVTHFGMVSFVPSNDGGTRSLPQRRLIVGHGQGTKLVRFVIVVLLSRYLCSLSPFGGCANITSSLMGGWAVTCGYFHR